MRCAKLFLPLRPAAFQRLLNTADDRFTYCSWITETHFALCRVHVYIDCGWIEIEKKKRDRILPSHERGVVAFPDSRGNDAAFDRAAVYKNELLRARLPAQAGLTDEPADLNFR